MCAHTKFRMAKVQKKINIYKYMERKVQNILVLQEK